MVTSVYVLHEEQDIGRQNIRKGFRIFGDERLWLAWMQAMRRRQNMSIASFGSAENNYNKQLAAAYITYMMAGSRFRKCVFDNPMEEEHLRLHYRAMKSTDQQKLEEDINNIIDRLLPEDESEREDIDKENPVSELYCEVRTIRNKGSYILRFITGFEDYEAVVSGKDGRIDFHRIAVS